VPQHTEDSQSLAPLAMEANKILAIPAEESIVVLNDKAYHNGSQIYQCEQNNITTLVAFKEQPAVKHLDKESLVSSFQYNATNDSYTCPNGATLTTKGTGILRKMKKDKPLTVLKNTPHLPVKLAQ
jgi:hypothetical protein